MEPRARSIAASSEDWTTSWLEEAQIFSLTGQAARLQSNQTFGGIGKILVAARKPSLTNFRDSYHDFDAHRLEVSNPFIYARRGYKRYDPHSRRYKSWYIPEDWYGSRIDGDDKPHYPRFTEQEGRRILRCSMKSRGFTPLQMGKEWNFQGPKRFDGSHDWFWQDAHRLGENMRQGLPKYGPVNPFLLMHQGNPSDLDLWMHNEI